MNMGQLHKKEPTGKDANTKESPVGWAFQKREITIAEKNNRQPFASDKKKYIWSTYITTAETSWWRLNLHSNRYRPKLTWKKK